MSNKTNTFDADWQKKYKSAICTAEEAAKKIRPGSRVFVGSGCAVPVQLVAALTKRGAELPDTEIVQMLTFGDAPYAKKELAPFFRINSFFIGENVRDAIQSGHGDYTPIFLSEIPSLFNSGQLPLDVALIQVTPPDADGMCSLGISVDIVKSAAENAALVLAQVNPNMPRTHGDSTLHVLEIDALVPVNDALYELPPLEVTEEMKQIAENMAALVEDGSTLELGIGRIPHALLGFLKDKKQIGIHTEMITDDIVDLVKSGVVTGEMKSVDRGQVVASFAAGTRKLYDFVNNNPAFSFRPTEYVNDSHTIGQQPKVVAINTALEIDLTGQVNIDSQDGKFFSGVGGQVDFNRGAARSRGGRSIIALPSTTKDGSVSRIVAKFAAGSGIVTTRAGAQYIVTEYGTAYLRGKSVQERALALISIAHPKFRAELLKQAIEAKFVSAELSGRETKLAVGSKDLRTTYLLADGTQVSFRPIHPTDEPRMRDLFYELSQQTIYYRFMSQQKLVPRKQIQDFVYIDHRNDVALVGTLPSASGEEIVAMGSYYLDPRSNLAEVAFIVKDNLQNQGLGSFLLRQLIRIARRNGIKGFTAEVLHDNKAMQAVINKSNTQVKSHLAENVISYEMDFE